jgi:SpoVK/Ycf46/Vps4 family AAA+-type ATPase
MDRAMAAVMAEDAEENKLNERGSSPLADLFAALRRLDGLIRRALVAAHDAYGAESLTDRFRGLHIGPDEVERLLAREPGAPALRGDGAETEEDLEPDESERTSQLAWLAAAYGLSQFDLDALLIALAPELDLRYERLYAYLQDDVTRRRPSVDLALNLLCQSPEAKIERRAHFAPEAPLIRHGLMRLLPEQNQAQPPLLAHYLKVDEQIVRWLLVERSLDERLAPICDFVTPEVSLAELSLDDEVRGIFESLADRAGNYWRAALIYLQGPLGAGQRRIAEAIAYEFGAPLLVADLSRAANASAADFEARLGLLFREAWLRNAILFLDGVDALRGVERELHFQNLLESLAETSVITILNGRQPWGPFSHNTSGTPLGVVTVTIPFPDFEQRRSHWQSNLGAAGIQLGDDELDALSNRFRLTADQIAEAVATTRNRADWTDTSVLPEPPPAESSTADNDRAKGAWFTELLASARRQSSQDLSSLAWKIEPHYAWSDIVLPDDAVTQLREICSRVANQHEVLGKWGFGDKLAHGKGVSALFVGSSGTGKTMAAEIIANELGLDLYKIDLSGVVSKYIGETEKNLDRIFTTAENANAILFFDEADALFGKRSEVHNSIDRYANIETSYLLQKMEQYEGIAILATNLRQNLDEAFTRRLQFIVEFPFPDEARRREIWQVLFPSEAPREEGIDFEFLAKQFRLSGGNIKNIVLGAAFLAASNGGRIGMEQLIKAARREHQKMGRVLNASDLGKYSEVMQ